MLRRVAFCVVLRYASCMTNTGNLPADVVSVRVLRKVLLRDGDSIVSVLPSECVMVSAAALEDLAAVVVLDGAVTVYSDPSHVARVSPLVLDL